MKRLSGWFFALFSAAFLFSNPVHAQQPWSNILTSNRAIDWTTAGLPSSFTDKGGSNVETTVNAWTPPTRTQYGSTINPSGVAATDLSNLNTALANCPDGHYVLLGPGTFLIQGILQMQNNSCTLRGSGPMSTTLSMSGSGVLWMGAAGSVGVCALTSSSNFAAGSTSITCTGSAPAVGSVVGLYQCDTGFNTPVGQPNTTCSGTYADNGGLFVCSGSTLCMTEPAGDIQYTSQTQMLHVTSVSGSGPYTVNFSPALYMPNWSYAQGAFLEWDAGYDAVGVGLEDMTVLNAYIQMQNAYASWIKGVRAIETGNGPGINMSLDVNDLISNNSIFNNQDLDGNYSSGVQSLTTSSTLFLNNITVGGVEGWEGFGGNVGNVFAYNLTRDAYTLYAANIFYDHHAYSSYDLFEGNQVAYGDEDDTWGTHDLNTYFRNYASCYDAPYAAGAVNPVGMSINGYQRFENLIGNAIGTAGQCSTYQSNVGGAIFQVNSADPLVASTLVRWGNVSVVKQSTDTPANSGIRFVESEVPQSLAIPNALFSLVVAANNNLPCSFFLTGSSTSCTIKTNGGTGLSWWRVCTSWTTFPTVCAATQAQPFPPAGPDESGGPHVNGYAYDIPATIAWQYLPIDTSYQNSYTITGSSWSGGTETLTISGLPASNQHVMGAFQLSGVGSACTSGATFGGNGEILMTGSSSTTVQYALASNPGVACTGTMKFPDVRQFDERVYESDQGNQNSPVQPGTPNGLTGSAVTVQ